MREKLKALEGYRGRFAGEFERFGLKPKIVLPPVRTVCLHNVVDVQTGELMADHVWLTAGDVFAQAGVLEAGAVVEFDARVLPYHRKPYRGLSERRRREFIESKAVDYTLKYPTRVVIAQR